jgi:hypothetical protein
MLNSGFRKGFDGYPKRLATPSDFTVRGALGNLVDVIAEPMHAVEFFLTDVRAGENGLVHAVPAHRQQFIQLVAGEILRVDAVEVGGQNLGL